MTTHWIAIVICFVIGILMTLWGACKGRKQKYSEIYTMPGLFVTGFTIIVALWVLHWVSGLSMTVLATVAIVGLIKGWWD